MTLSKKQSSFLHCNNNPHLLHEHSLVLVCHHIIIDMNKYDRAESYYFVVVVAGNKVICNKVIIYFDDYYGSEVGDDSVDDDDTPLLL